MMLLLEMMLLGITLAQAGEPPSFAYRSEGSRPDYTGNQLSHVYEQIKELHGRDRWLEEKLDKISDEQIARKSVVYGAEKHFENIYRRLNQQDINRQALESRVKTIEDQRTWEKDGNSHFAKEFERLQDNFWWLVGVIVALAIPALLEYGRHTKRYIRKHLTIYEPGEKE